MAVEGIFGTGGFVVWFYMLIYLAIRKRCTNIYMKLFIHTLGVIIILIGWTLFVKPMLSFVSVPGLFIIFAGLVFFVLPLGVD